MRFSGRKLICRRYPELIRWRESLSWDHTLVGISGLTKNFIHANFVENGERKLILAQKLSYGKYQVECKSDSTQKLGSRQMWEWSKLSISDKSKGKLYEHIDHQVLQLRYHHWSDNMIPNDPLSVIQMMICAHTASRGLRNGAVVHCSAGIGRAGTFSSLLLCLAPLLDELEK
ncbi:MAG: hypothetical protein EZS28_033095, partial [Streblomastix strix]